MRAETPAPTRQSIHALGRDLARVAALAVAFPATLACGARTEPSVPDGSAAGICPPPVPWTRPCTTWQPTGPPLLLARDELQHFGSVTAVATDCHALVAWSSSTTMGPPYEVRFATRRVAWDGSTAAPPVTFADLTGRFPANDRFGWWELSLRRDTVAALSSVNAGGGAPASTRYVPLDLRGVEQGAPVNLESESVALLATSDGFSYLAQSMRFPLETVALDEVNPDGSAARNSTITFASGREWAMRAPFDDGSFLLVTGTHFGPLGDETFVRHFDAHGGAIAEEADLTRNFGIVGSMTAPTRDGAVVAWTEDGLRTASIDRDGNLMGSQHVIRCFMDSSDCPAGAVGSLILLSVTTAHGDVVIVWEEGYDAPQTFSAAVAPDGTLRGAATLVTDTTQLEQTAVAFVAEPNGRRALLVYASDASVIGGELHGGSPIHRGAAASVRELSALAASSQRA